MVLLVVLLAHVMLPGDDPPPITPYGNIAGLHKTWEDLHSACRKLPHDTPEREGACLRRDVLGWELGQLGWCVRSLGLETKLEMCPPTRR